MTVFKSLTIGAIWFTIITEVQKWQLAHTIKDNKLMR
jgi:hypothetical protein